ncbi:MAG: hypothetical protein GY789_27830 [Hyphomicrobiales bacterium]|nr:hypothetical protein [Hyphomicrobiales bacterium]
MFSQNKLMVIFLSTAMSGMAAKGALFPNAVYAGESVDEAKPGNNQPVATAQQVEATPEAKEKTHVGFDSETTVGEAKKPEDVEVKQVSGEQISYSRGEAYRASGDRDPETGEIKNIRIVLHYGKGVYIDSTVRSLEVDDYPVTALPGGPDGKVKLFVGRGGPK